MAEAKIKLGEKEFSVSGLTIGQCRDLRIGDATPQADDGSGGWKNLYQTCIDTIAIAIRESHPQMTEAELWKIQATEDQIATARREILVYAGFRPAEQTIAEMRAMIAAKKTELASLEKALTEREEKAKTTGEG